MPGGDILGGEYPWGKPPGEMPKAYQGWTYQGIPTLDIPRHTKAGYILQMLSRDHP